MRLAVDGMNVIGSRPTGWWRDRPGAMRKLVEQLAPVAAEEPEPVLLFLDGRERDVGAAPNLEIRFAPGGRNAADDAIAAWLAEQPDPAAVRVVTSDRELTDRIRALGAEVETAGSFLRRLERAP